MLEAFQVLIVESFDVLHLHAAGFSAAVCRTQANEKETVNLEL